MTMNNGNSHICKEHNQITNAKFTEAPALNPTSSPKTSRTSFSGALFCFFFGQAKKKREHTIPREKVAHPIKKPADLYEDQQENLNKQKQKG
jgi:hypothetical protein